MEYKKGLSQHQIEIVSTLKTDPTPLTWVTSFLCHFVPVADFPGFLVLEKSRTVQIGKGRTQRSAIQKKQWSGSFRKQKKEAGLLGGFSFFDIRRLSKSLLFLNLLTATRKWFPLSQFTARSCMFCVRHICSVVRLQLSNACLVRWIWVKGFAAT